MPRIHADWIAAYQQYASHSEAPPRMHFWTAASCIAGALRRKVWIEQAYFQWYANMYIVFVAPPGIVSKSSTADIGMELLRKVPGVRMGPSVVTMQALVSEFSKGEMFEYKGSFYPMSAMTISSSEFGNLVDPNDKGMIDMLVHLWDGKSFNKATKMSGNDQVINPWLNAIACTTPHWIAANVPEYMIGGGFTSRTIFVYADEKSKLVAYPGSHVPVNHGALAESLLTDLIEISKLAGEYRMSPRAVEWGEAWYKKHYTEDIKKIDAGRFGGYAARKQTHMHKLAMILAASSRDDLIITDEDLKTAYAMITDLEPEMVKVFEQVGMKQEAFYQQRMSDYVRVRKRVNYTELYRVFAKHFPRANEFEEITTSLQKAGLFRMEASGSDFFILWCGPTAPGD